MYFAYGWPKLYATGCSSDDDFVLLQHCNPHLIAVTRTCVQVWSGGQHRIRLGQHSRPEADLESEGHNVRAFWCPPKSALAVLVSSSRAPE